nr:HAD-IA family hydrolase [Pseudoruegeria sp. HB172150]
MKLVIFDVDGTLVDSEADIWLAMVRAFESAGLQPPPREAVAAIIGMSVDVAVARLVPEDDDALHRALACGYRNAYRDLRLRKGSAAMSPLFPGAREMLARFKADPWTLLGIATGKSRRGLNSLIEAHELEGMFVTTQVADDHPSKPHPSMIEACLAETGASRERTVMIGDTSFDMEMARAAGVRSIGVSWGIHAAQSLRADILVDRMEDLPAAVDALMRIDA